MGYAVDWTIIIQELGGGLSAIVLVGLAWWGYMKDKRANDLTDKFVDLNTDNIQAMNRLTTAIREGKRVDD